MAKKKHPIVTVVVILGVVALFLATTMILVLKYAGPSAQLSFGEKIGVIPVEGTILNSRTVVGQLVKFKKDKGIKAIILRINTPGGGVGPSQEIYREVEKTAQEKKIVVSMGGVAASGGYYIAAAADRIVANPGTITGSIGVRMEFLRLDELMRKIGVNWQVFKSGEFKDIGSPHRAMTDREKELINGLIGDIRKQFVEAVAKGRNLAIEKVDKIADGRILSGAQAKELGLVDLLGNFRDAVDLTKNLAGIEGEATLIYPKKGRMPFLDLLFDSAVRTLSRLIESARTRVEYKMETS